MLADAPLVLNVRGDARICVPPLLEQTTCYVLLEQEDWFEDEIRFVRRWLRPGMRAIDVGAGFGVYSVAIGRAVGEGGRVWAFEPTPASADFITRTLELNGLRCVELIRSAVTEHRGEVAFALAEQPEENKIVAGSTRGAVCVPGVSLDEAARQHGWSAIDFLKLDVEGHEFEVFRGAAEFLRRNSPLLMFEIKTMPAGVDLRALEPLAAMGYEFYRLLPGMLVLTAFDREEPLDRFQLNLFACKADRARQLAADGVLAAPGATVGQPHRDAWLEYARATPYAHALGSRWPSKPGFFSASDDKLYLTGLAAFARSRALAQSAGERVGWLEQALQCVGEAVAATGSLARWLSFARLAWETGRRDLAFDALSQAVDKLDGAIDSALAEPFLAPGERYDRIDGAASPRDWLRCAVIEQYEKVRAFSSRFVEGSAELLAPILELPFRSAEMDRRSQLVRLRKGIQQRPEPGPMLCERTEENLNPAFWCPASAAAVSPAPPAPEEFSILSVLPELPRIKVVDVGAMSLGEETDPYFQMLKALPCEVIGFEPLEEECKKLNRGAGEHRRYLPYFIADGSERSFYRCAAGMTSSLFEPNLPLLSMFQTLEEVTRVVDTRRVRTTRLDDVPEARGADLLKVDVQGAELLVFQGAKQTLREVLIVHTEAEFVPMYRNQPLFADIDAFMRGEGFVLHKLASIDGRTFKPMMRQGDPASSISQQLWCDAVYVRDFTAFDRLSPLQLRKLAAMLHTNYGSFDLAAVALAAHDRQTGSDLQRRYLDCFAQAG